MNPYSSTVYVLWKKIYMYTVENDILQLQKKYNQKEIKLGSMIYTWNTRGYYKGVL